MPAQFDTIPSQKIAYLVMRKCGCSSIKHAISNIRDLQPVPQDGVRIHGNRDFQLLPKEFEDHNEWFTFTIVRDPIIRFISFYANKILDQNLDGNHTFLNRHRFGLLPNMSVDQVIDILVRREFQTEPHIEPQTELLNQVGFKLDYIGRLEKIPKCLDDIEAKTGVRLPIQHLNRAKQKPIIPRKDQFEKLADFYRNDLIEFDYPRSYDDWCRINIEGKESKFRSEAGYTFENEAKLLYHSITRRADRFVIELKWRVHDKQFRKRVIRVIRKVAAGFEAIWHLPPRYGLIDGCDEDMIVRETIDIPCSRMPADVDLDDVYHELFFTDQAQKRAKLTDYFAHENMLVFPFGHLQRDQRDGSE